MSLPGPGTILYPFSQAGMKVYSMELLEIEQGIPVDAEGVVTEYYVAPEDVATSNPEHAVVQHPTTLKVEFEVDGETRVIEFMNNGYVDRISDMDLWMREHVQY